MRIVAVLCWSTEPTSFLWRLVRSLAGHVDALVAVDGAWKGFEAGPASSREERDVIRATATEVDLPTRLVIPDQVWESQAVKRAHALGLAIEEHDATWVLVVDGDTELSICDDDALRLSLELTDRDVALVRCTELNRAWPYSEMPVRDQSQRHLYRGIRGLTYRNAHNGIVTSDGRWLNGDPAHVALEPALDLTRVIGLDHDNQNRGRARNDLASAYRKVRETERLESWL